MDKVRFGVIGFGNMGSGHVKNLAEGKITDGVLAAICDTNEKKIERAKEAYPGIPTFSDAETMMKSGLIDAVIIATPHYYHPPLATMAFENGIHAMSEKPAGVYTKQVRLMNEAAAKHPKIVFGMMFNQRTNCVYRKMKEMVENGSIGEMRRFYWIITDWYRPQAYYDSGDWRATWGGEGGGVLLNQCPHNLDLWQWICGMPVRMTAFMKEGRWHNIEVEDDVVAYAEYANGANGVFITTTADYPGTNRFEVSGDLGKLVCEGGKLTYYKNKMSDREFSKVNTVPFGGPGGERIEVETDGQNPQHNGVLSAFTGAILRGEPLVAKGNEGINGLMLSNAMHLSSWLGKPGSPVTVTLPVDEELFYAELQKKIKK